MSGISEFTSSFFDASSKAWKKNKIKYDQSCYTYKKNAFQGKGEELPEMKVSKATKLKIEHEIHKRQSIDEPAPLRERRSSRIRLQHICETYAKIEG